MVSTFYAVAAGVLPTLIALFSQLQLDRPLPVLGNMAISWLAILFAFAGWVIAMVAVIRGHDPSHALRWIVYLGMILPMIGVALASVARATASWRVYRQ